MTRHKLKGGAMVQVADIGWGSYKQFEGPYYIGKNKYEVPKDPSDEEKIISVITSTEGGSFSSINMYDSCILSSGLIQWCEAHFLVSSMIGFAASRNASLLSPLEPALKASGASFKQRKDGKWRFFFDDARGEVNSSSKQQALFFKNSTGAKGSWDDESRSHAKLWAACVASMWQSEEAQHAQVEFTASRIGFFHTSDSKAILFGQSAPQDSNGIAGAIRAAYSSFAANLPAVASEQLRLACSQSHNVPWTEAWMIDILRQLTFGPKIAIYPGRYEKIRPVIESLYGVDLPDFASDLNQWRAGIETNPVPGMVPDFVEISEIQAELIREGYDLGPKGADGSYGPKTKQAVREFQEAHKLSPDGMIGPNTRKAMMEEYMAR